MIYIVYKGDDEKNNVGCLKCCEKSNQYTVIVNPAREVVRNLRTLFLYALRFGFFV